MGAVIYVDGVQEVTEDETPDLPAGDLASIRVVFERGSFKEKNKVLKKDVAPGAEEYEIGPINEDMKRDFLVGVLTELGERTESAHVKAHSVGTYIVHPDDVAEGFYSMKLHYAPKELLRARGILNEPTRNGAQKATGSASRQKRSAADQPEAARKRARKAQDRQEVSAVKPAVD
ncbi:hypothetical protein QFC20_007094 [Naganishia adeliensis]|uniref:Uncharacterized protein n=1 Tax=Naganishia adeliensis TaxID=92952 RepID=A0ACC2V3D2_9TREE|nr:hypothetical protein QFC20_007094 [Naganishia adeliensis]